VAYLSTTPTPPLTWEIPGAVKELLLLPREEDGRAQVVIEELLYGQDRVYTQDEDTSQPEGVESVPWGRVVVMLADRLARFQEYSTRHKIVRVLVKAEVNDPGGGFSPRRGLEAIQLEVFRLLEGRTLVIEKAGVEFPLWRVGMVNEEPLWDQDHGTWVMTSEFRCVLKPA
jgi:hypothetical protein